MAISVLDFMFVVSSAGAIVLPLHYQAESAYTGGHFFETFAWPFF
jgi:hypothetical protein